MKEMVVMCEGNPGCARVVGELYARNHMVAQIFQNLQDMNIRGVQIYIAWKDVAEGDIAKLTDLILKRDPEMVRQLNQIAYRPDKKGLTPIHYEKAVEKDGTPK